MYATNDCKCASETPRVATEGVPKPCPPSAVEQLDMVQKMMYELIAEVDKLSRFVRDFPYEEYKKDGTGLTATLAWLYNNIDKCRDCLLGVSEVIH